MQTLQLQSRDTETTPIGMYNHPSGHQSHQHKTSLNLLDKMTLNANLDDMKIHVFFNGLISVIYYRDEGFLELAKFQQRIRDICQFDIEQPFTLKWVDEEGDPCTVSSQIELDEIVRLYYLNKERELFLHVFANAPQKPGMFYNLFF